MATQVHSFFLTFRGIIAVIAALMVFGGSLSIALSSSAVVYSEPSDAQRVASALAGVQAPIEEPIPAKAQGQALTEAINHPRSNDEDRGQLKCPKCGIAMRPHKYKSSKQVNVDECYQCGGFFLDSGELNVIKDTFMSEQERDQYIQKMLSESPEYQELEDDMERQIQIQKERTKAIRNMTKYITISYYMNRGK